MYEHQSIQKYGEHIDQRKGPNSIAANLWSCGSQCSLVVFFFFSIDSGGFTPPKIVLKFKNPKSNSSSYINRHKL